MSISRGLVVVVRAVCVGYAAFSYTLNGESLNVKSSLGGGRGGVGGRNERIQTTWKTSFSGLDEISA